MMNRGGSVLDASRRAVALRATGTSNSTRRERRAETCVSGRGARARPPPPRPRSARRGVSRFGVFSRTMMRAPANPTIRFRAWAVPVKTPRLFAGGCDRRRNEVEKESLPPGAACVARYTRHDVEAPRARRATPVAATSRSPRRRAARKVGDSPPRPPRARRASCAARSVRRHQRGGSVLPRHPALEMRTREWSRAPSMARALRATRLCDAPRAGPPASRRPERDGGVWASASAAKTWTRRCRTRRRAAGAGHPPTRRRVLLDGEVHTTAYTAARLGESMSVDPATATDSRRGPRRPGRARERRRAAPRREQLFRRGRRRRADSAAAGSGRRVVGRRPSASSTTWRLAVPEHVRATAGRRGSVAARRRSGAPRVAGGGGGRGGRATKERVRVGDDEPAPGGAEGRRPRARFLPRGAGEARARRGGRHRPDGSDARGFRAPRRRDGVRAARRPRPAHALARVVRPTGTRRVGIPSGDFLTVVFPRAVADDAGEPRRDVERPGVHGVPRAVPEPARASQVALGCGAWTSA